MLTTEMVKQFAIAAGADLCGIGALSRFEGAPPEMDPRYIYPEAQCLIGLGFRIPRGVIRGNEEGTNLYQYPSTSYAGINEIYAPTVLYELGRFLEDHGHEAVVFRNTGGRGAVSDATGERKVEFSIEDAQQAEAGAKKPGGAPNTIPHTRPAREGAPPPDIQFHFRIAAYICGLGEIGWSKMLLTPQFGPLQRFAFILTDAPLEADPLYDGDPVCIRCMACVRECPGNCISATERMSITIEEKTVEWGKLAEWQCYCHYMGANPAVNPYLPAGLYDHLSAHLQGVATGVERATSEEDFNALHPLFLPYNPSNHGYKIPKCGGCLRACVNALERGGALKDKFQQRFRTADPWRLS